MNLGIDGKRALVTESTAGIGLATARQLAAENADVGHAREIDILVNNVGIFEPKPFEQIPDEDWLRFFETNVLSGVRLARRYLPGLRSRGWGRSVFVSSESLRLQRPRLDDERSGPARGRRRRALHRMSRGTQ